MRLHVLQEVVVELELNSTGSTRVGFWNETSSFSQNTNVLITEPHIRALHTANKFRSASGIQEKGFYLKD